MIRCVDPAAFADDSGKTAETESAMRNGGANDGGCIPRETTSNTVLSSSTATSRWETAWRFLRRQPPSCRVARLRIKRRKYVRASLRILPSSTDKSSGHRDKTRRKTIFSADFCLFSRFQLDFTAMCDIVFDTHYCGVEQR